MKFQFNAQERLAVLVVVISLASLFLLIGVTTLAGYLLRDKGRAERQGDVQPSPAAAQSPSAAPTAFSPDAAPVVSPSTTPTSTPFGTPAPSPTTIVPTLPSPALNGLSVGGLNLIIPVAGIKPEQLRDTFSEARSAGRVHSAIDIMAPHKTPVLAAADGKIARLFFSDRGGVTIYQLSQDQKTVLYYAHLDQYAPGLSEGKFVRQGETIAYVGDTGNAGAGNYHLHFGLWQIADPKRFWTGENINPYPILRQSR